MANVTWEMEYKPGYKDLNAYIKADDLVLLAYKLTKEFPREEIFGLVSQMRRCAISVPANIVEGYGHRTSKDKLQFYYIARGSLNELEYYIELSLKLGYINEKEYKELSDIRAAVGKTLNGLIKFLNK